TAGLRSAADGGISIAGCFSVGMSSSHRDLVGHLSCATINFYFHFQPPTHFHLKIHVMLTSDVLRHKYEPGYLRSYNSCNFQPMLLSVASRGDDIAPKITQPIAARGESVQALMLILLTLRAMMAAIPPPSKKRVPASTFLQFLQACHKATSSRARNTMRTGRPAIAPNSRYELCGCDKGRYCAGTL